VPCDWLDGPAVHGDLVDLRVDENAGRRRSLTVHAHRAGRDQLIGGATAGHAGSREEAVQAFLVRTLSVDGVLASSRGVGR